MQLQSFEIGAPGIGEIVSGQKKSKHLQKMLKQKQFENSWEVQKRNPSVELDEPFLQKVGRKTLALAKTLLTI